MGVTIFCQAHENGGDQEIKTSKIKEAFAPNITELNEFGFRVEYDAKNSSFVFIDIDSPTCSGFSISRPCGDERLFKSLYECMKLGNFVCFIPGLDFIVVNSETINHLPVGMREHISEADVNLIVASNYEEFYDAI